MKTDKIVNLPLDKFINISLYNKKSGYYIKKNPFGKKGDFITAPNVSRLFSEMIAIWVVSFWKSIGSPKEFNVIELGAGNAAMMKILIESFKKFPSFFKSCRLVIYEISPTLKKIQKKELLNSDVNWVNDLKKIKKIPSIFVANEFFDALAIKQFQKKGNLWFEKFVSLNKKTTSFLEKKINMKNYEKKINFNISKNQNFIEYSELGINYLKQISKIIKARSGGILIIDYGYNEDKMKNTLQALYKHEYSDVLAKIGNSDITHNINFRLFEKIIKKLGGLKHSLTTQKEFLTKMGIYERAEMIAKNQNFLKKADIYYRLKRLTDEKQMGNLFKVMLIKNQNNNFNLGF